MEEARFYLALQSNISVKILFTRIHVYLYFKDYFKKFLALTKDVPENIQRLNFCGIKIGLILNL